MTEEECGRKTSSFASFKTTSDPSGLAVPLPTRLRRATFPPGEGVASLRLFRTIREDGPYIRIPAFCRGRCPHRPVPRRIRIRQTQRERPTFLPPGRCRHRPLRYHTRSMRTAREGCLYEKTDLLEQECFWDAVGAVLWAALTFVCRKLHVRAVHLRGPYKCGRKNKKRRGCGASACQKIRSSRTSPQAGAPQGGLSCPAGNSPPGDPPKILRKPALSESKMLRLSGGFPRQCSHWLGMTIFDSFKRRGCGAFAYLFFISEAIS